MKKLVIGIGLYCSVLFATKSQSIEINKDSLSEKVITGYKSLKIDEINFVNSYYSQNGNNSPVTGGIGTEKLFDIASSLDIKLKFLDRKKRENTINLDLALDYYSSASSDMIDSRSLSSASKDDYHYYPSISWSRKNEVQKNQIGASLNLSTEWDYKSIGGNLNYSMASADNNTELSFKFGAFFDKWMVVLPNELRPQGYPSGAEGDQDGIDYKPRNSYNFSVGLSQIINQRLQMMVNIEPSYQEGLLSTPFHRIYFSNEAEKVEKLPGQKAKLPASIRVNYFLGDRFVFRSFYRYYIDNWGMKAHTVSLEIPIKINAFLSLTPHYRYNSQGAVKYFAPYKKHDSSETFYTSDYDISKFNSAFFGLGLRMAPPNGIFGIRAWNTFEIRYGHYNRTNGLSSNIISIASKFK